MKFISKTWWIFALGFIAVGIALAAAGWGLGANGKYLYFSDHGLNISNYSNPEDLSINEQNLNPFTKINVSTISAKIELIPSDHYGVEAWLPDNDTMNWNLSGSELIISEATDWTNWSIFTFNFSGVAERFVKIYYPAEAELEGVWLSSTSGSIKTENAIAEIVEAKTVSGSIKIATQNSRQISLKSTSGSLKFTGDAKTTADNADFQSTSGSIRVENLAWDNLNAESTSGSINISGNGYGQATIKNVSGSIEMAISGKETAYSYDLASTSGSIRINDEKVGNPAHSAGSTDSHISAKSSSGSIRLTFSE